jgi:hypothetical protein
MPDTVLANAQSGLAVLVVRDATKLRGGRCRRSLPLAAVLLDAVAATLAVAFSISERSRGAFREYTDRRNTVVALVAAAGSFTPVVSAAKAATLTSGKSRGAFK